jgi:hypothetical protein
MSASDRRSRLDRAHPELSIRRQCAMLGLARSGVYRKTRPANDNDLEAMRRIDAPQRRGHLYFALTALTARSADRATSSSERSPRPRSRLWR